MGCAASNALRQRSGRAGTSALRQRSGRAASNANGVDIAAGPTAPVALTGGWPTAPEEALRTMSPGARAGIRSRQAVGPVQAPFLPAWRFRDRSFRGGPAFHLVRTRPKPSPSHPRRAGSSGHPATCPRVLSTCHAAIRGSRRTGLFPGRAAFAAASNCPTVCCLSVIVTLRFRGLPEAIGLLASMIGCCARRVSRSSCASPTYPPQAVFAVDKCG